MENDTKNKLKTVWAFILIIASFIGVWFSGRYLFETYGLQSFPLVGLIFISAAKFTAEMIRDWCA